MNRMRLFSTLALATSLIVAQNTNLGKIVVSATNSEQNINDVTSDITVISKEQLEDWHVDTVLEALDKIPGISIAQSGGIGQQSSFYLRGFASQYTLVLVDGVKLNDPTAIGAAANLSNLLVDDIERIEIVKGPQSGIYGANAVAGVINIITKKASKDFNAKANLEYGSFATRKANISLSKKVGAFSGIINYSYLKSNSFSAAADINKDLGDYEDDKYENKSYNIKLGYEFTKNDNLNLEYIKIKADTDFDAGATLDSTIPHVKESDKFLKVDYTHKYSDNSYSKLYYHKSTFNRDYIYDFLGKATPSNYEGELKDFGIDNKITFNNIETLFGVNREIAKDKKSNNELKSTGVYLTNIFKFNKTILTTTLRRDNYSDYKDKTTGKIGVKHSFDNGLVLKANYGTAYRVPTLSELYGYGGNKDLKPETINGYDLGFEYKNFEFSYFYNKIKEQITYQYDPATYSGTYINSSGNSKIKGFELSYKSAITQDLFASINYTRFIAKDSAGYQLAKRPNYEINLDLDYYGFKNTHINFNAKYIGKRVEYAYGTHNIIAQTGHVFVANASVDYKINKNMSAYLKINNIFDRKYQNVYGYATSPRAFYVGVNAKF